MGTPVGSSYKFGTGFEEMESEFPYGKTGLPFGCTVAPGNFPLEKPETSCSVYFPIGNPS